MAVIERVFCHDQKVNGNLLMKGDFPHNFNERFEAFKDRMLCSPFEIYDDRGRNREEIVEVCEWALSSCKGKEPAIFIDHIQRCRTEKYPSRQEAIADYVQCLKEVAMKYNASVIATSQINRAGAQQGGMDFLKGSGEQEEASDVLCICQWPCKIDPTKDPRDYIVRVEKNRNGPTGDVKLRYEPDIFTFSEERI